MATRRPKVPRVAPAAQPATDVSDGADVISADFASRKSGSRHPDPEHPDPKQPEAKQSKARQPVAPVKTGTPGRATTPPARSKAGAAGKPGHSVRAGVTAGRVAARGKGRRTVHRQEEDLDPIPAKAFSGRMLALAVVMIAITIMLAPTVKIFIDKRAEIAALEADIAASRSHQGGLRQQVSRWQDPNYVKQQARDRINMVMPGETGYWVYGSDVPAGTASSPTGAVATQDPADLPWVDSLWESIRRSATD
ncbi:FtsB family cell division protein [Pseudarthrobacter sp. N5]|uniref:FtsB family cell division protein n=1 Tax=Pseudarthrobacter sp. N5 TaxID=3418416 RepID=UPI003CEB1931